MEGFQVDIIFNSLKELQEEKGKNECILAEEYGKRKELEAQLEEVNSEHRIAAEKNSKMKETMKVAEMKVAQIQAQVKMMEQVNNEKRERIRQLNQHIEQLEQQKAGQLSSFESQMNILTEKFRTAWHEFGDKALDMAVEECDKEMETLSTKVASNESHLSELTSQLEQLKIKEQEKQQKMEEIPTTMWQTVIGMFEAENEASKTALEKRKQSLEVEGLREQKVNTEKQLEELKKKLGKGSLHREE